MNNTNKKESDEKITTIDSWNTRYQNIKLPVIPDTKSWLGHQIFSTINEYIDNNDGKTFLEAGCAPGRYGIYFSRLGYRVAGFDYSPDGVAITRANWNGLNINAEVIEADVFDLPERLNNSFDVVLSAGLIEHFSHPERVVGILGSLLKDDGLIITIVPNTGKCLNCKLKKIFRYKDYKYMKETHIPISMEDLLRYHDQYEVLCAKYIIGFFPDSIFSSNNIIIRIIKRLVQKIQLFIVRRNNNIRSDYFSSHFMVIARKRASIKE